MFLMTEIPAVVIFCYAGTTSHYRERQARRTESYSLYDVIDIYTCTYSLHTGGILCVF